MCHMVVFLIIFAFTILPIYVWKINHYLLVSLSLFFLVTSLSYLSFSFLLLLLRPSLSPTFSSYFSFLLFFFILILRNYMNFKTDRAEVHKFWNWSCKSTKILELVKQKCRKFENDLVEFHKFWNWSCKIAEILKLIL